MTEEAIIENLMEKLLKDQNDIVVDLPRWAVE